MKRIFGLITICSVLAVPVLAAKPVDVDSTIDHPLPATDVHLVEKTFLSPDSGETRGKPTDGPPRLNKKKGGPDEGVATGSLGESLSEGANKYAVVIGICNYPGKDHDICWSDGDSLNMYNALIKYGYTKDNIYLLRDMVGLSDEPIYDPDDVTDGPASIQRIEGAISQIESTIGEGDEVVFFFSGHGGNGNAEDNDGEGTDEAIITYDEVTKEIFYLWDGQLRDRFNSESVIGKATSRIIFVFDSCLAGGMNDVADAGRVVPMATEETRPAYVYSKGEVGEEPGEGVFSHYFANEGMLQGLADVYDHDGDSTTQDVTVEEAFDYAKDNIKGRQKPVISDDFTDDLLL